MTQDVTLASHCVYDFEAGPNLMILHPNEWQRLLVYGKSDEPTLVHGPMIGCATFIIAVPDVSAFRTLLK
jgi:hypothetical protein